MALQHFSRNGLQNYKESHNPLKKPLNKTSQVPSKCEFHFDTCTSIPAKLNVGIFQRNQFSRDLSIKVQSIMASYYTWEVPQEKAALPHIMQQIYKILKSLRLYIFFISLAISLSLFPSIFFLKMPSIMVPGLFLIKCDERVIKCGMRKCRFLYSILLPVSLTQQLRPILQGFQEIFVSLSIQKFCWHVTAKYGPNCVFRKANEKKKCLNILKLHLLTFVKDIHLLWRG